MITSQKLHTLSTEEFCAMYRETIIKKETETIIGKVLYEQFHNKRRVLKYDMRDIPVSYHIPVLENLEQRLQVTSIYLSNTHLYVDWALSVSLKRPNEKSDYKNYSFR
jgi:hypothetical protein